MESALDDFIIIRALVLGVLKLPICYFIPLNHKTHALPGLLLLKNFILYLQKLLWLGSKLKIIYFILYLSSFSFLLSLSNSIFSLLRFSVSMVVVVGQFWVVMIVDLLWVTMDPQLGCGLWVVICMAVGFGSVGGDLVWYGFKWWWLSFNVGGVGGFEFAGGGWWMIVWDMVGERWYGVGVSN